MSWIKTAKAAIIVASAIIVLTKGCASAEAKTGLEIFADIVDVKVCHGPLGAGPRASMEHLPASAVTLRLTVRIRYRNLGISSIIVPVEQPARLELFLSQKSASGIRASDGRSGSRKMWDLESRDVPLTEPDFRRFT